MAEYPLSMFMQTQTFRKMITLRMPDSAHGIQKDKERVAKSVADSSNMGLLESKSRPNLEKYGFQPSLYEKSEKEKLNLTYIP